MEYAIVAVPAAAVRRKPDHRQEMVNQLLFGESVQVLKSKKNGWSKIRSLHDNYDGWVTNSLLQPADKVTATTPAGFVSAGLLSNISFDQKQLTIPIGSSLPLFTAQPGGLSGNGTIGSSSYHFSGPFIERNKQPADDLLLQELCKPWMNVPYLWGGRTPLGIDCSGFVQLIFKLMGIDLHRDAWQQAAEGRAVKKLANSQPGDLVFFSRKKTISHVGILLGENRIIHCSGRVKTDLVDKKGIADPLVRERTSALHSIRRIW